MWEKIKKAAFEGILFRKTIVYIFTKLPQKILDKLDWLFGCIVRNIYAIITPINPTQIMLISFQGDFTCNPKYIYKALKDKPNNYNYVFSARKTSMSNGTFPPDTKLVEQYSADYYQEIAKSKVIIANSVELFKKPMLIKKQQIVIES